MSDYPYSKGDLLEKPNTYFYTPYNGMDFLLAWSQEREKALQELGNELEPSRSKGPVSYEDLTQKIARDKKIDTAMLLDTLYASLSSRKVDDLEDILRLARKMVKKFEVTKRIHEFYDSSFRTKDEAGFDDLGLYVKAAEVFEAAYVKFDELPFLNALIKCIDTLSSAEGSLKTSEKGRLARLISKELYHVRAIARLKGVNI